MAKPKVSPEIYVSVHAFVPSHTSILPIHVWAVPYAYGQPIHVLAAHMCMGYPYAYGPKLLLRPYVYECPYAYQYVGPYKYSYSYDIGVATISF